MATITLAEAIRTGQYGNAPGQTVQVETPGPAAPPGDTASIIASFFGRQQGPTTASPPPPGSAPPAPGTPPVSRPAPRVVTPDLPNPAENPALLGSAALKGLDTVSTVKDFFSRPSIAAGAGGVGSVAKLAGAGAGLAGDTDLSKGLSLAGSGIDLGKSVLGGGLSTVPGALSLASGVAGVVPGVLNAAGVKIDPYLNAGISIGSSGLSLGSAIAAQPAATAAAGTAGIAPAVGLLGPVAAIAGVALALKAIGDSRNAAIEQGYITKAKQAIAAFKADPNVQAYQQNLDRLKAGDQSTIPSIQDVISKAIITQEAIAQPSSGNTTALRPFISAGFEGLSTTPGYRQSLTDILATLDAKYGQWHGPVGSAWAEPGHEPPPEARVHGLTQQYNAPPLPDTPPANAVYVLPRGQTANAPAVPDPNAEQKTIQVGPGQFSTMWVDRRTGRPYPNGTMSDTSGRPVVPWQPGT